MRNYEVMGFWNTLICNARFLESPRCEDAGLNTHRNAPGRAAAFPHRVRSRQRGGVIAPASRPLRAGQGRAGQGRAYLSESITQTCEIIIKNNFQKKIAKYLKKIIL